MVFALLFDFQSFAPFDKQPPHGLSTKVPRSGGGQPMFRRMWEFQEQKFPSIFNYGFVSPCVNFHFEIILHFSVRLSTTASLE